jgi:hypothetical protein
MPIYILHQIIRVLFARRVCARRSGARAVGILGAVEVCFSDGIVRRILRRCPTGEAFTVAVLVGTGSERVRMKIMQKLRLTGEATNRNKPIGRTQD